MVNRLGARSWTLTNEFGHPAGADKSSMGAINRPLRRLRRRFWYILVHVFISIIGPYMPSNAAFFRPWAGCRRERCRRWIDVELCEQVDQHAEGQAHYVQIAAVDARSGLK